MMIIAAVLAAGMLSVSGEGVKVSSFGFDPVDSTEIIQKAIDSGAPKIVFDRQSGPWVARPLVCRSNIEVVFEDGVELVAKRGEYHGIRDYLFRCECVSNIVIRGLGEKGGTLRMWKSDYLDPKQNYAKSEWRYALRLCAVENVLVENMSFRSSGGDGIVIGAIGDKSSKNVTVRKCICDDNHRQGISLCAGENILIEDTILSNTRGTPPEAGIDFEPDRANEKMANIVLRNVISKGNAGNGYDIYLKQLRDYSTPVSIRFENCRSIGNRFGTSICGDNFTHGGVVKGVVEFIGCEFGESNKDAIRIVGTPAGALDVSLKDCTVINAHSDVSIEAGSSRQGAPDGITFDNLTIHQATPRRWFNSGRQSFGPQASNIRGNVTVVTPDGKTETVVIDDKWVSENLPAVNGGRMPAPQVELPPAADVAAVETNPGEMTELSPVALAFGGRYLLYVPKAGKVTVFGHQVDVTGKRPETTKKTFVRQLLDGGKKGRGWEFVTPGFKGGEISFKAPAPGFYSLITANGGTRFIMDRSSVPIAVDVREREHIVCGVRGRPFSLWFYNPAGRVVSVGAAGDDYNRFSVRITDPTGVEFSSVGMVEGLYSQDIPAESKFAGLWKVDYAKSNRPAYDWVRVEVSGIPGALFLSADKYWR